MLGSLFELDLPLVLLDVETHAFVPAERAHIVDLSMTIFEVNGSHAQFDSLIKPPEPITLEASKKHGISNEMVEDAPDLVTYLKESGLGKLLLRPSDYAGYNHRAFDMKVLEASLLRIGVKNWSYGGAYMLDAYRLWTVMCGRTLADAVEEFLKRQPTDSHRAAGDVYDTHHVLLAMFERWPNLPRSMKALHEMCFKNDARRIDEDGKFIWVDGVATCGFGKKWNGFPMRDVHRSYYEWIINSEFAPDTKRVARDALNGVFPTKS